MTSGAFNPGRNLTEGKTILSDSVAYQFFTYSAILGNVFFRLLIFFKKNLKKIVLQEYNQGVKQFGSRSGPTNVMPDLSPNCLVRLSADDTSRQSLSLLVVIFGVF